MPGELVLQALRQIWLSLEPLPLPRAVMGGVAVAYWGHVRATQDVDLLIQIEPGETEAVLHALAEGGIHPKRHPPVLPIGPIHLLPLLYRPPGTFVDLRIDLLFAESEYQRLALARRVTARVPGLDLDVAVLTCEDLIIHKLIAGRILDRIDVAALLRRHRATLDFAYLREWIDRLALTAEWTEVWSGAFPGEPPPGLP
jgi:hypothetical protein